MRYRRRHLSPYILAYFRCNGQLVKMIVTEKQLCSEWAGLPSIAHRFGDVFGGSELAYFVELAVIRYQALRNKTEQSAAPQRRGDVIYFSGSSERHTDENKRTEVGCCRCNSCGLALGGFYECIMEEKILTCVSGDAELGKNRYHSARTGSFFCKFDSFICVECTIRDLQLRDCSGDFYKSVFHF